MCDISNSYVQRFKRWYFPDKSFLVIASDSMIRYCLMRLAKITMA